MERLIMKALLITTAIGLMGLPSTLSSPVKYVPAIQLESEIYITDKTGVAIPSSIIRLKPIDNIKIYLPDGTELKGIVTSTEDINREMFKVFGDIQNKPNTGFGFVLTKDGIFAGAVVFRDTDTTYTLNYSEDAKGFILIRMAQKKKLS